MNDILNLQTLVLDDPILDCRSTVSCESHTSCISTVSSAQALEFI